VPASTPAPTVFDRVLRPLGPVRAGEGLLALLMLAWIFTLLASYYVMKTAREGLILSSSTFGLRGEELKAYAGGAIAIVLAALVPAYGALAGRVLRLRLINLSYAAVIGGLVAFFVAGRAGVPIGLAFFVWVGMAYVMLIAQFWSYATDVYTEDRGKRLFAIIATGGSIGAVVGPRLARLAGTFELLLVAAAIMAAGLALFNLIERHHRRAPGHAERARAPIGGGGGFTMVVRDRYLLLIAALVLVAELVKTTGEYILSKSAAEHAAEIVPATSHPELPPEGRAAAITDERREVITSFYADFYFWANLTGFVTQALLVSRLMHAFGVQKVLFVTPMIALGGYAAIAAVGGVALIGMAKVAENSTEYSVESTVRQTLFLPTDRATKYKAKAAIDTFVVRGADTLSGLLVWVGSRGLGFGIGGFAAVNVVLTLVWFAIAAGIAQRYYALGAGAAA
jgi:AAA family ATP:ADP antiporter